MKTINILLGAAAGFILSWSASCASAQSADCGLECWTSRQNPVNGWLWDVAYGAGRFVAVGDNGAMLTSEDGLQWQIREQSRAVHLGRVENCNGQFLAMGRRFGLTVDTWSAVLWTSTDGKDWVPRYNGTNTAVYGVAYGDGRYVSLGNVILKGPVTHQSLALTSEDGEQWIERAAISNGWLYDVTYGDGKFVAVGGTRILWSRDGVAWQPSAGELPTSHYLHAVGFFRHQFIAVGAGGTILTSPDGDNWAQKLSGTTTTLATISTGDGVVAVAGNDGVVLTSLNGFDWNPRLSSTPDLRGLAYGADTFVTVGRYGTIHQSGPISISPSSGRPVITLQPADTTVFAGQMAALSAAASGAEPLTYQWFFNSNAVPGAISPLLAIPNVQPVQAGSYHVVVTNLVGAATSSVAELTVLLPTELKAPTISFLSPSPAFTRVPSNTLNVAGMAFDNFGLSNVTVISSTNAITLPLTGGTARWSTAVSLEPGTNFISATVSDLNGNAATDTRVVFYATRSPLTLTTTGEGAVRGATNQQSLEVGGSHTLTAYPKAGFVFSNWTGGLTSSAPALHFLMRSNLAVTANFVPNPFTTWAGTYNGLFHETNAVRHEASGLFSLALRGDGSYSARLQQGNRKHPFTGRFDLEGRSTNSIKRSGTSNLVAELALNLHGADQITGRIIDANWESVLMTDRATFNRRTAPATNYANRYTLLIPGSTNIQVEPAGDGAGSFTVDVSGTLKLTGMLADGLPMVQRAALSKDGVWPLYIPLYKGLGSVLGWILITNSAESDLGGLVSWSRPAGTQAKLFTNGFAFDSMLIGSGYRAPGTNTIHLSTNGIVSLHDGNLGESFTNHVTLQPNARVTDAGTNTLRLTLTQKTGQFSGSVTPPGMKKAVPFKGALLQKQGYGGGYFLGTNQSGRVYFGQ